MNKLHQRASVAAQRKIDELQAVQAELVAALRIAASEFQALGYETTFDLIKAAITRATGEAQ